ncbi:SdrD B-like domain-containing protein, partial [Candidatus Omnitrophota bacterium]
HQESKYYSSPSGNYISDKLTSGLRFSLIGDLYYYINKEVNWISARYTGESVSSHALNTGLDWHGQIFKSPLWGTLRLMYRDEEDAASPFSFLAGEDYIEGYAELSYRPKPDLEAFLSARVRNVWAENPDTTKRIEANFYAGMRYLWDTGVCWESIGTVEGYVFKDINGDGLMEIGEIPVQGVEIWLGKNKSDITDEQGYYLFENVKARKAYVNINTSTIPYGFLLTGPATQEVAISHHQSSRADFGITSRTEIIGVVFYDTNGDGKFGSEDHGIKGVILILDDGSTAETTDSGRYYFRKLSVGERTVTMDLDSLPAEYLPAVPIFRNVELFEGTSYNFSIPLKKIK